MTHTLIASSKSLRRVSKVRRYPARGLCCTLTLTAALVHEDPPSTRILDLEDENAALYRRIAALEREILGRSPTKPMKPTPLQETRLADDDPFAVEDKENEGSIMKLGLLKLVDSGVGESEPKQETAVTRHPKSQKTPGKKMRKLTPRTNVGMRDEELIGLASP